MASRNEQLISDIFDGNPSGINPRTRNEALLMQALQAGGGGGVTDYTKLENKPTETVGGDTLTWDGNTEGLVSAGDLFYKVSDVELTAADLANGISVIFSGHGAEVPTEEIAEMATGVLFAAYVVFVAENGAGVDAKGMTFPESGIYFITEGEFFVSSLTIPGYTGFAKEVLKKEVLPFVIFYPAPDGYIYTDVGLTTKATKAQVVTAAQTNSIAIQGHTDGVAVDTFLYPVTVQDRGDYARVVCIADVSADGSPTYTAGYTAEYSAT